MTALISQAFAAVAKEAGKSRTAYLIVDEGDSLTSSRATVEIHHEDKVAVNTLIQKLDAFRRLGGRALVFLCTNRYEVLDPAILRRSLADERFDRPNADERRALLEMDLEGLDLDHEVIDRLVAMTGGSDGPGYTFSDLRTRLLPSRASRPRSRIEPSPATISSRRRGASPRLRPSTARRPEVRGGPSSPLSAVNFAPGDGLALAARRGHGHGNGAAARGREGDDLGSRHDDEAVAALGPNFTELAQSRPVPLMVTSRALRAVSAARPT